MQANNIQAGPARPQNISCPAGGSNPATPTTACGQRGVVVAPPSGNTNTAPRAYQVLHKGFDTLVIAIKAQLPPDLFDYLETQKELADKEQRDVLIEWNGVRLHLKGHGGAGYRFIASGGPLGASWAIKKPNPKDKWGFRVSFGSSFLASLDLGGAIAHLENVLERFDIRIRPEDISISRVDYCVDLLAPDFALIPDNFVMHSSTNRRDHLTENDKAVNGRSGRVTSVTVGGTRARQIIVYDKRHEVVKKQKNHWWMIWNKARKAQGQPPLSPDTPKARIWRVEFRAGKDLLKDRWNIRTWEDLYARLGDLYSETGRVIRYTDPQPGDSNRARWPTHPLWEAARVEINTEHFDMSEGGDPSPVKEVIREQHISVLMKNLFGSTISLAALYGVDTDDLPGFFHKTAGEFEARAISEPDRTARHLQDGKDRYVFVTPERGP